MAREFKQEFEKFLKVHKEKQVWRECDDINDCKICNCEVALPLGKSSCCPGRWNPGPPAPRPPGRGESTRGGGYCHRQERRKAAGRLGERDVELTMVLSYCPEKEPWVLVQTPWAPQPPLSGRVHSFTSGDGVTEGLSVTLPVRELVGLLVGVLLRVEYNEGEGDGMELPVGVRLTVGERVAEAVRLGLGVGVALALRVGLGVLVSERLGDWLGSSHEAGPVGSRCDRREVAGWEITNPSLAPLADWP
eukprot:g30387.t1